LQIPERVVDHTDASLQAEERVLHNLLCQRPIERHRCGETCQADAVLAE
jgi:hypothetical protein